MARRPRGNQPARPAAERAPAPAHAHGAVHPEHPGHGEHHIIPLKTYYAVFVVLIVLLLATVGAAFLELGPLNLPLALAIAIAKAAVIMAYFMHLKYSSRLVILFALSAFIFLGILFLFTLNDYYARGWLPMLRP